MFNELKHKFYMIINDLKHELGIINDREYFLANLQENARFYQVELNNFVTETKNETLEIITMYDKFKADFLIVLKDNKKLDRLILSIMNSCLVCFG